MKWSSFSFAFSLGLASASAAAAPSKPIVVVDVTKDLDPASVRKTVASELGAEAVARDDPRAAKATGEVSVEARAGDKKLVVRYRKLAAAVTRTVDLPAEPQRLTNATRFLVGNLARDEANDLLKGLEKPAAPPPSPPPAPPRLATNTASREDELELARMQTTLDHYAEESRRSRQWLGWTAIGIGTSLLVTSAAFFGSEPAQHTVRWNMGLFSGVFGAALTSSGLQTLLLAKDPHEKISKSLANKRHYGVAVGKIIADIEDDWKQAASSARTARTIGGWILIGAGAVTAGIGFAHPAIQGGSWTSTDHLDPADAITAAGLMGLGLSTAAIGAGALFYESKVETTYRVYTTGHLGDPAPRPSALAFRPRLGMAPLPGGAMLSLTGNF